MEKKEAPKPDDPKTPVEGEKPAEGEKKLPEGGVCVTSDECADDYACLMTWNKTETVKEKKVQFLCVQDNKKGCNVRMKNVLSVNGTNLVSLMTDCLPRMESLDAAAALKKE